MGDTVDTDMVTTEARGPLMPNPRLMLQLSLNPRLRLMLLPGEDTTVDITDTDTVTPDMATTVTTWARGPLRLMPNPDTDTMAVDMDTMVDTVDTDTAVDTSMVELLKIKSSGSSHSISFNLATTIVPSFF